MDIQDRGIKAVAGSSAETEAGEDLPGRTRHQFQRGYERGNHRNRPDFHRLPRVFWSTIAL